MSRELEGDIGLAGPIDLLFGAAGVVGTDQSKKKLAELEKWTAWPQIKQLRDPNPNNLPMINFLRACTLVFQNSPDPFKRVTVYVNEVAVQVNAVRSENPVYYQMRLSRHQGDCAHIAETPDDVKEWLEELYPGRHITAEDLFQAIIKRDWTKYKK